MKKSKRKKGRLTLREKALLLCGAAATGHRTSVRILKGQLSMHPDVANVLEEFLASKKLQINFRHDLCPKCRAPILSNELEQHLKEHLEKTKGKRKLYAKDKQPKKPKPQPKPKPKKRVKISNNWIEISSQRSTLVIADDAVCLKCRAKQKKNRKFWRYANTSEGPLILCERCKQLLKNGEKQVKGKKKSKPVMYIDAMSRRVSGGAFDSNRRRH